jgi:hypothetical protein
MAIETAVLLTAAAASHFLFPDSTLFEPFQCVEGDAGRGVDHAGAGSCTLRTATRLDQGRAGTGAKFRTKG